MAAVHESSWWFQQAFRQDKIRETVVLVDAANDDTIRCMYAIRAKDKEPCTCDSHEGKYTYLRSQAIVYDEEAKHAKNTELEHDSRTIARKNNKNAHGKKQQISQLKKNAQNAPSPPSYTSRNPISAPSRTSASSSSPPSAKQANRYIH